MDQGDTTTADKCSNISMLANRRRGAGHDAESDVLTSACRDVRFLEDITSLVIEPFSMLTQGFPVWPETTAMKHSLPLTILSDETAVGVVARKPGQTIVTRCAADLPLKPIKRNGRQIKNPYPDKPDTGNLVVSNQSVTSG